MFINTTFFHQAAYLISPPAISPEGMPMAVVRGRCNLGFARLGEFMRISINASRRGSRGFLYRDDLHLRDHLLRAPAPTRSNLPVER